MAYLGLTRHNLHYLDPTWPQNTNLALYGVTSPNMI